MAHDQSPSPRTALGAAPAYRAAAAAVADHRFGEAIFLLRRVLAATPENIGARVLLGTCLAELGETGPAEGMLRSATALDPVDITAHLHLGDLLVALGRQNEALGEFRAVLTIDPEHPVARTRMIELS